MSDMEKPKRKNESRRWARRLFVFIFMVLAVLYMSFALVEWKFVPSGRPSEFDLLSTQIAEKNCSLALNFNGYGTAVNSCDENAYTTYTPRP
jgi:hypothetical protein